MRICYWGPGTHVCLVQLSMHMRNHKVRFTSICLRGMPSSKVLCPGALWSYEPMPFQPCTNAGAPLVLVTSMRCQIGVVQ